MATGVISITAKINNPLSAADVYIYQILKYPKRLQSKSFVFIVVLRTRKRLTPIDVAAVEGLNGYI
jgi:hypothetical protein